MCVPGGFCICGGKPPPVSQRLTAPASGGRFTLSPLAVKRSETGESSRESKYGKGVSRACGKPPMKVEPIGVDQARATGSTGTPGFIVEVMVTFVM